MEQRRVTVMEEQIFCVVLDKLASMHQNARRANRCWVKLKTVCLSTGNWKRAPRGKPNRLFGSKRVFPPVYVPTGTYD